MVNLIQEKLKKEKEIIIYDLIDGFVRKHYLMNNTGIVTVKEFKNHFEQCNNFNVGQKAISLYMNKNCIGSHRFWVKSKRQKCWIGLERINYD